MLIGEERRLVEGGDGESLVVVVEGGAVQVPLFANVCHAFLLLVKLLLLNLLPLLLLVLFILVIRAVSYKMTGVTTFEAGTHPLGPVLVEEVLVPLQCGLEALDDKHHLFIVVASRLNLHHVARECLLVICRFESNNLRFVRGEAPIGDVINVLCVLNRHLMANKLSYQLLKTYFGVPRVFAN
jgi:hypothetical protein